MLQSRAGDEVDNVAPRWFEQRWVRWTGIGVVCAALAVVGWLNAESELGPSTVYTDDAWVLLGWKAHRLVDFRRAGLTSPGFVAILRAWLDLIGFSNLNAQLVPLAAAALAPPTFLLVALRMRLRFSTALLGAVMLFASPTLVSYATRVKQFSFDLLLAIVLIGLAALLLRRPTARGPWIVFSIASVVALVVSFALFGIVAAAFAAVLVAGRREVGIARLVRSPAVWCSLAVGGFVLLWMIVVIGPLLGNDALHDYWASSYFTADVNHDSSLIQFLFQNAFTGPYLAWIVTFVAATALVVWRRPTQALLFGLPVVIAVAGAAVEMLPLGGGRTDVWLYAPMVFMIVSGVDIAIGWLGERRSDGAERTGRRSADRFAPVVGSAAALVVAGLLLLNLPTPAEWLNPDVVPLLERLETVREDDDLVVTSGEFAFTYPLYAKEPLTSVHSSRNAANFYPSPEGVNHMTWTEFEQPVHELRSRSAIVDDVWLLDTPSQHGLPRRSRRALTEQGFVMRSDVGSFGGSLQHWQRA